MKWAVEGDAETGPHDFIRKTFYLSSDGSVMPANIAADNVDS
jgi:hypothetical protein